MEAYRDKGARLGAGLRSVTGTQKKLPAFAFAVVCWIFLVSGASAQEEKYLKGENATLLCSVDEISGKSADQSATYMWYKHGGESEKIVVATKVAGETTISEDGPLSGRASLEPPFLHIRNLEVTDSATYECHVITAGVGLKFSTTVLKVNAVPIVSVELTADPEVDGATGQYEAAVCVAAGGSPPARIIWVRSSTGEIQDVTETTETLPDGTLTVKSRLRLRPGLLGRIPNTTEPVREEDATKNFSCVVSHDYFRSGSDVTGTVSVNLLYPPVVTIAVESNRLTCAAFGNPVPQVTWTRPDGTSEVGTHTIFVDQTTPTSSSGRYVCVARSSIGPEAVAAIHVKNSRDLPTLFTNTLRYNASLPVNARGYEMECKAEVESLTGVAVDGITFDWTKDDLPIDGLPQYKVVKVTKEISSEKSLVTSVLRIKDVRRNRDEGLFRCRLSLPSPTNGYVRAVERCIQVTVDYPPAPGSVMLAAHPAGPVRESADVKLTCNAASSPRSSYQWFFNGDAKHSGSTLTLRNVSRTDAGVYRCVAYNYVPGSATKEVKIVVQYPPGKAVVHRVSENSLECATPGGSVPEPLYTWLLPNGTATSGNISLLHVPTFDVSVTTSYICVVTNGLDKTANSTYVISPAKFGKVGSLSIGEFVVTMVVCLLLLILITVIVAWIVRRREWGARGAVTKSKKDSKSSTLLHYTEPPYGGSIGSMPPMSFNRPPSDDFTDNNTPPGGNCKNYDASKDLPNGKSAVLSPRAEGKPSLVNFGTRDSKSNLAESNDGGSKQGNLKYRSIEQLDGSGVEILDNASVKSAVISKDGSRIMEQKRNGTERSPVKLSTFSNPSHGPNQTNIVNHYGTARNPPRNAIEQARPMTRALSEGFRPMLFNDTMRPDERDGDSVIPTAYSINTPTAASSANDLAPPNYSALKSSNMAVLPHRPATSSPLPLQSLPTERTRIDDHETESSDDASSVPSTTRLTNEGRMSARALPMTEPSLAKPPIHPGIRYNAVSHDPYGTYHPDRAYRPSPTPSPILVAGKPGYDADFTPPMAEIPNRNYIYQPYEARLGVPLASQPSGRGGGSTATSPYDSGSDSAKSSVTNATGRRLQSLTLV